VHDNLLLYGLIKQSENGISVTLVVFAALIPPCAAIECARRGESSKDFTLYPNSANVAEAEPPANPSQQR
jgi:hypothetical protein